MSVFNYFYTTISVLITDMNDDMSETWNYYDKGLYENFKLHKIWDINTDVYN